MRVEIDVKELLGTLQQFNPESDLTGVKAYLFDLVVSEGSPVPSRPAKPVQATKKSSVATPSLDLDNPTAADLAKETFQGDSESSFDFEEDDIIGPEKTAGTPSRPVKQFVGGVPNKNLSPKEKKALREKKRAERIDFASMSPLEAAMALTGTKELKKVDGQFVTTGVEGADGDDIELG